MRNTNTSPTRQSIGLAAFIVGGLVGGLVALLYAPRTGKETREFLIHEGQEQADQVIRSVRETKENFLARFDEAQARIETMNRDTRQRLKEFQKTAHKMVEEDQRNIQANTARTTDLTSD